MSVDDEELAHSTRGPSGAHRYRRCACAPAMEEQLPDTAGLEAAQGTVFHYFAGDCLEFGIDPREFIGSTLDVGKFGRLEFTEEMALKMRPGIAFCNSVVDPGDVVIVEKRVDISPWCGPDQFGTTDWACVSVKKFRIVVFDWKWGGYPVLPEWNDQAILYTLGVWYTFAYDMFLEAVGGADDAAGVLDDVEVWIVIEQPRAPGGGGLWKTTIGELLKEGEKIKADVDLTYLPDAPRTPGPVQCKFCSGAKLDACPEYVTYMLDKFDTSMEELEGEFDKALAMELPRQLTPKARSQILLHKSMIESWLSQLHADAYNDAENDRPVPGMKLVDGRRSPRAWKDVKKAEVILSRKFGPKAFVTKLKSPAAIEDEVGTQRYREEFEALAVLGDAKPQLVSDEDDREARASRMERFDDALGDETDSLI